MARTPPLLVFDVNETLSDMSGMAQRFTAAGLPPERAALWFAGVLRDGFALTAAGATADFAVLAHDNLLELLEAAGGDPGAVDGVLSGIGELDLHPDVVGGLRALAATGARLVTLSNGASSVADRLLRRAGVRDLFEALLSVQDAPRWKPAPEAYRYALAACGVGPADAMLVAVHPWDVDGAARAGLRTAWVDRTGRRYPSAFTPAEVRVGSLDALAAHLRD